MKKYFILLGALGLAACTTSSTELPVSHVFFDFDSARLSDVSKDALKSQSLYLKHNPDEIIVLEGNCDERGSTEYNLALGALRAGNVEHFLIRDGIEPERIRSVSYGKERPQALGHTEAAWRFNRNVTMHVKD